MTAIEIKIRGMADESFDYDDDQTTTDQDYLVKHQILINFDIENRKSLLFKIPFMTTNSPFSGEIDQARTCFDVSGKEELICDSSFLSCKNYVDLVNAILSPNPLIISDADV